MENLNGKMKKKEKREITEEIKNDPIWKNLIEWRDRIIEIYKKKGYPYSEYSDEELLRIYEY